MWYVFICIDVFEQSELLWLSDCPVECFPSRALSVSVCLLRSAQLMLSVFVQLESACRAGYIIDCNVVTSHAIDRHIILY